MENVTSNIVSDITSNFNITETLQILMNIILENTLLSVIIVISLVSLFIIWGFSVFKKIKIIGILIVLAAIIGGYFTIDFIHPINFSFNNEPVICQNCGAEVL